MERILHINSCIRGRGNSRTLRLYDYFIERYKKANSCEVDELFLGDKDIPYLNLEQLKIRDEFVALKDFSDSMFDYAKSFITYDKIIVSAPYWDLLVPAVLKNYIEQICVSELTFKYAEKGFLGLAKASEIIFFTNCGGYVENNLGVLYIKEVAKFLGIEKFSYVSVDGLDIDPSKVDELILEGTKKIELELLK